VTIMPKPKKPPLEADIQNDILKWLRKRNIFCWRNNSGFIPIHNKQGKQRRIVVGNIGLPDILGYLPDGHGFAIEVKRNEKSTISPIQHMRLGQLYATNVYAFVAWSVEQVENELGPLLHPPI
jgi:hypothetical protein